MQHKMKAFFKNVNVSSKSVINSKRNLKSFTQVPGPKSVPFLGNYHGFVHPKFGKNPKYAIQMSEYIHKKYGNLVRMEYPFKLRPPKLYIFDPDMCEKVYRTAGPQPIKNPMSGEYFTAAQSKYNSTKGLLVSQKSEWWNLRSRVQQPLLRPKNLLRYIEPLENIAMEFVDKKIRKHDGNELNDDFLDDMYKWALENVGLIAYNKSLGCLDENLSENSDQVMLIEAVGDLLNLMGIINAGSALYRLSPAKTTTERKFWKTYNTFNNLASKYVNEAFKELRDKGSRESRPTLLELFKDKGCDESMSLAMATDMSFAGIDSTSNTVGFCLYFLSRNLKAQEKLSEEVIARLGSKTGSMTTSTLDHMPYLKACLKETLRLRGPIAEVPRALEEDIELGGYLIPKGVMLLQGHHVMSNSNKYVKNPNEFLPDRWIKSSTGYEELHPFVSLPFGHGPRMCVGRRFAELESHILILKLIQNFQVEYHQEDIGVLSAVITQPDKRFKFSFVER